VVFFVSSVCLASSSLMVGLDVCCFKPGKMQVTAPRIRKLSPHPMSVIPTDLIEKLRKNSRGLRPNDDDAMLCRFLRARQFDCSNALAMLQDYIAWRNSYRPEQLNPLNFRIRVESCQAFPIGTSSLHFFICIPVRQAMTRMVTTV